MIAVFDFFGQYLTSYFRLFFFEVLFLPKTDNFGLHIIMARNELNNDDGYRREDN
jgi:hypothetical protein